MSFLKTVRKGVRQVLDKARAVDPAKAYDLWASSYDTQQDNLLIHVDEQMFAELSADLSFEGKVVADVGCGTGRHWPTVLAGRPSRLIGYDVSREMIAVLRSKYPGTEAHVLQGQSLPGLEDASCDVILCNLVIGYIDDLRATFAEWNRVLKPGGVVVITDLHPAVIQRGGDRSFSHRNRKVLIRSHLHSLEEIRSLAAGMGWMEDIRVDRRIDERIRPFYEARNALSKYETLLRDLRGTEVAFGWRFSRGR